MPNDMTPATDPSVTWMGPRTPGATYLRHHCAALGASPAQNLMDLIYLATEIARDIDVAPSVFHQMIGAAKIDLHYGVEGWQERAHHITKGAA